MTRHSPTIRPEWATRHDRAIDVSDVWQEETDPTAEYGEECIAFLSHYDRYEPDFELVGISVRDHKTTAYYDRETAIKFLGADAVWRIESIEMEAV